MNLDNGAVNIRPRSLWEAIDTGFLLAHQWYGLLWRIWLLVAFPFALLIGVCCHLWAASVTRWFLLLFWTIKPFFEPFLLLWVADAMFGDRHKVKHIFKTVNAKTGWRQWALVLLYRLHPFRFFLLPIIFLEKLSGKARKDRLKILRQGYENTSFLLASIFAIEVILSLAILAFMFWLIPEELRWINFGEAVYVADGALFQLCYFVSCSIMAPFYMGAGFMVYISRRVELEAWDIEIGFKKIRQRFARQRANQNALGAVILLGLLFGGMGLTPFSLQAAHPGPDEAHEKIASVLADKTFGEMVKKESWAPKEKEKPDKQTNWLIRFLEWLFTKLKGTPKGFISFLASSWKIILCILLGGLIVYLLIKYPQLYRWLGNYNAPHRSQNQPPEILFGIDIRPQSLPEDIPRACLKLLREGQQRKAMGLLYRGTLSQVVNGKGVELRLSDTETECYRKVSHNLPANESRFFREITRLWIVIAYGHQKPATQTCRALIDQWDGFFGRAV